MRDYLLRKRYHTCHDCPECAGSGWLHVNDAEGEALAAADHCYLCDGTGHGHSMSNTQCWCGEPGMREIRTNEGGWILCRRHARYVDPQGNELLSDQLAPHPEEAHLWPEFATPTPPSNVILVHAR